MSTGLLFAAVLLVGVYALYVGFAQELYVENSVEKALATAKDEHLLQEAVSQAVQESS